MRKFVYVFLLLSIGIILIAQSPDYTAILIDEPLYNDSGILTELNEYIANVQANVNVIIDNSQVLHKDYQNMDENDVRNDLITLYNDPVHPISGAILIGFFPSPMFVWYDQVTKKIHNSGHPHPLMLYYEDLDADFYDNYHHDKNENMIANADPSDYDGIYDYWEHHDDNDAGMLEIWVSLIRPYDTGNPGGYETEEINQIRDFLAKCNKYYNNELAIPNRAMVYSGYEYATYKPTTGDSPKNPYDYFAEIYDESNVYYQGYQFRNLEKIQYASANDFLERLSSGFDLVMIRSHSDSGYHNFGNIGPADTLYVDDHLRKNIGKGSVMTMMHSCQAAHYVNKPDGCLAAVYTMESEIGQVCMGVTRSGYLAFEETHLLANDEYFGQYFRACMNRKYMEEPDQEAVKYRPWSQLIMGNPYVRATDNFCAPYGSISGQVSWSCGGGIPDVLVKANKGDRFIACARTDQYGYYIVDYLEEGTYNTKVEVLNGDTLTRENIIITAGGGDPAQDFVFDLTEELISFNSNWDYTMIPSGQSLPTDWNTRVFNADTWDNGKGPFIDDFIPKEEGTIAEIWKYRTTFLGRKKFILNDTSNLFLNLSADWAANVYLNDGIKIVNSNDMMIDSGNINTRDEIGLWNKRVDFDSESLNSFLIGNSLDYNTLSIDMLGGRYINAVLYQKGGTQNFITENHLYGDFCDDGIYDTLRIRHSNGYTFFDVANRNSSGENPYVNWLVDKSSHISQAKWLTGDFNGDGKTDVVKIIPFCGEIRVAYIWSTTFEERLYFEVFLSDGNQFRKEDWSPYFWQENLLMNFDFEKADSTNAFENWSPKSTCTLKRISYGSEFTQMGSFMCHVEDRGDSTSGPLQNITDALNEQGPGKYLLIAYVRTYTNSEEFQISVEIDNGTVTEFHTLPVMCDSVRLHKIAQIINIDWDGTLTDANFIVNSISGTESFILDACVLEKKPDVDGFNWIALDFNHDGICDLIRTDEDVLDQATKTGQDRTCVYTSSSGGFFKRERQVFEAEAKENNVYGDFPIIGFRRTGFSGGHFLWGFKKETDNSNNYVEFPKIHAIPDQSDSHTLSIYYADPDNSDIELVVNELSVDTYILPANSGLSSYEINIDLSLPVNSIRLIPHNKNRINEIDKIEIKENDSLVDGSLYFYEAEEATLAGTISVVSDNQCSRKAKVTGISGSDNAVSFVSVVVDQAGTYTCVISYKAKQNYDGVISVNSSAGVEYYFAKTGEAIGRILVPVDLAAGTNTITIQSNYLHMADIDCISIISGFNPALPLPTPKSVTRGDVNENGTVDIIDALLTAQYYVRLDPAGFYAANGDTNCDGNEDIIDALLIAQYYVQLINQFC